jgi:hypothetical protein
MVVAGLALTAVDSLLMPGRAVRWNYWDIYPAGTVPTKPTMIERDPECAICGAGR